MSQQSGEKDLQGTRSVNVTRELVTAEAALMEIREAMARRVGLRMQTAQADAVTNPVPVGEINSSGACGSGDGGSSPGVPGTHPDDDEEDEDEGGWEWSSPWEVEAEATVSCTQLLTDCDNSLSSFDWNVPASAVSGPISGDGVDVASLPQKTAFDREDFGVSRPISRGAPYPRAVSPLSRALLHTMDFRGTEESNCVSHTRSFDDTLVDSFHKREMELDVSLPGQADGLSIDQDSKAPRPDLMMVPSAKSVKGFGGPITVFETSMVQSSENGDEDVIPTKDTGGDADSHGSKNVAGPDSELSNSERGADAKIGPNKRSTIPQRDVEPHFEARAKPNAKLQANSDSFVQFGSEENDATATKTDKNTEKDSTEGIKVKEHAAHVTEHTVSNDPLHLITEATVELDRTISEVSTTLTYLGNKTTEEPTEEPLNVGLRWVADASVDSLLVTGTSLGKCEKNMLAASPPGSTVGEPDSAKAQESEDWETQSHCHDERDNINTEESLDAADVNRVTVDVQTNRLNVVEEIMKGNCPDGGANNSIGMIAAQVVPNLRIDTKPNREGRRLCLDPALVGQVRQERELEAVIEAEGSAARSGEKENARLLPGLDTACTSAGERVGRGEEETTAQEDRQAYSEGHVSAKGDVETGRNTEEGRLSCLFTTGSRESGRAILVNVSFTEDAMANAANDESSQEDSVAGPTGVGGGADDKKHTKLKAKEEEYTQLNTERGACFAKKGKNWENKEHTQLKAEQEAQLSEEAKKVKEKEQAQLKAEQGARPSEEGGHSVIRVELETQLDVEGKKVGDKEQAQPKVREETYLSEEAKKKVDEKDWTLLNAGQRSHLAEAVWKREEEDQAQLKTKLSKEAGMVKEEEQAWLKAKQEDRLSKKAKETEEEGQFIIKAKQETQFTEEVGKTKEEVQVQVKANQEAQHIKEGRITESHHKANEEAHLPNNAMKTEEEAKSSVTGIVIDPEPTKVVNVEKSEKVDQKEQARRRETKEQTQLRDDKDASTDDEEVCLIKKMKQAKKSDIEARVKGKEDSWLAKGAKRVAYKGECIRSKEDTITCLEDEAVNIENQPEHLRTKKMWQEGLEEYHIDGSNAFCNEEEIIKVTMKQAKKIKDKTVDSTKDPLILRESEADGNSYLPTERSSFSMSQLQNLAVVHFDNQETDDCKKVFDKDKKEGKYNVVDQASLVDEKLGYATKDTHLNEVKQTLDKKALQERGMAPTNDQVHSVVEEKECKPGKFLPTNKAQETEGFQSPGIRLTTKRKPRPEASPLWFRWGELQKRYERSE